MNNKIIKTGREVYVDYGYYEVLEVENEELPTAKAWCKDCAREICRPIAFISWNGRLSVVVECEKCKNRYILYMDRYITDYVGRHTQYGFVPPKHGKNTPDPRAVVQKREEAKAERMKVHDASLCRMFNKTPEELAELRKDWKAEQEAASRQFDRERADIRAKMEDDAINSESARRKRAIERGAKYDPVSGGITDPVTGEFFRIKK